MHNFGSQGAPTGFISPLGTALLISAPPNSFRAPRQSARRYRIRIPVLCLRLRKERFCGTAQRLHHGQLPAGQEADQRAAAGADVAQLVGHSLLLGNRHAAAVAGYSAGFGLDHGLEQHLCAQFGASVSDTPTGALANTVFAELI